MYKPENIIWLKNVKKDRGNSWAYNNVHSGSTFWLNWPTKKKGSASTPNVGDIIMLFQTPNYINNKRNYKVYITHLVSPVSDTIYTDNEHPDHKWCREVRLIAKANPISAIPNPGYYNFSKPNRGLTNPIKNLEDKLGLSVLKKQEDIWRLFKNHFCSYNQFELDSLLGLEEIFGELEGDVIIKEHITQEFKTRNSKIVQLVKEQRLNANNGRHKCECCDFDFFETYGEIGFNFIECHHKIHISTGERITQAEDLALVCSNCHRMLHRKLIDGSYHTIESLKQAILLATTN